MNRIIKEAVENFINSIEAKIDECKNEKIEGYVSKIQIRGDKNFDIYVVVPNEKLSYISNYYFGDDNFDVEDLTKEISNQIIGNAKIIAAENNVNFDISVPEFLGEYNGKIDYDDILAFRFNGDKCFFILFKGV